MSDFDKHKSRFINELMMERKYFSNSGKAEREKDCVHWFLKKLDVAHEYSDLDVPEQASVVDVKWKDARFQVKEILDPSVKRGEIKEILRCVEKTANFESLSQALVGEGSDIPAASSMCSLVFLQSAKLSEDSRYVTRKSDIDLLFYVTRTYSSLMQVDEVKNTNFAKLGWRSVSVLNDKQAAVITAANDAPAFLQSRAGNIYSPF